MLVDLIGGPVFVSVTEASVPSGRAAVLVHGAGMDHSIWEHQVGALVAAGITVVAPDLPGHGQSAGAVPATVEDMAGWLLQLVRHLQLPPVSLVGHSMGSYVALEFAATNPGIVERLALAGTADTMPVHPDLLAAAEANDPRSIEMTTAWSLPRTTNLTAADIEGYFVGEPSVLGAGLRAVNDWGAACDRAAEVGCPTLVISGDGDRMTRPDGARRLAECFDEVETVELDAGHVMMIEDPGGTNAALGRFLSAQ